MGASRASNSLILGYLRHWCSAAVLGETLAGSRRPCLRQPQPRRAKRGRLSQRYSMGTIPMRFASGATTASLANSYSGSAFTIHLERVAEPVFDLLPRRLRHCLRAQSSRAHLPRSWAKKPHVGGRSTGWRVRAFASAGASQRSSKTFTLQPVSLFGIASQVSSSGANDSLANSRSRYLRVSVAYFVLSSCRLRWQPLFSNGGVAHPSQCIGGHDRPTAASRTSGCKPNGAPPGPSRHQSAVGVANNRVQLPARVFRIRSHPRFPSED